MEVNEAYNKTLFLLRAWGGLLALLVVYSYNQD